MIITPIKTDVIKAGDMSLETFLDRFVPELQENTVLVLTSKIISLCENRTITIEGTSKDDLYKSQADLYLPPEYSKYGAHLTIIKNTLVSSAGIDESNSNGQYLLWPKDPQTSTNLVRSFLKDKFRINHLGVILTDSTISPLRRGITGVAIAHSGLKPLKNYIGTHDLFGREMKHSQSNVTGGLASAAVVVMGEAAEQTPIALISDAPFVEYVNEDPSSKELESTYIDIKDDLFAPILMAAPWKEGGHQK